MYVLYYLTGTGVYIAVGGVNNQIVHFGHGFLKEEKNKHNKYAVYITSRAPEFTPIFSRVCVTRSLFLCHVL
jgi:hypothetical protein